MTNNCITYVDVETKLVETFSRRHRYHTKSSIRFRVRARWMHWREPLTWWTNLQWSCHQQEGGTSLIASKSVIRYSWLALLFPVTVMTLLVFQKQKSLDTFDCMSVLLFVVVLTRCTENKEATAISLTSKTCAATLEVVQSLLCIVTDSAFYRPTSFSIRVGSILYLSLNITNNTL